MAELIRLEQHCNERFKTIDLEIIENSNLSWKAKGLHTYLISRPPGWRLWQEDLVKRSTDGKAAVSSAVNELKTEGYLATKRLFDDKGRFDGWQWTVAQTPCLLESQQSTPLLDQPQPENQTVDTCPVSDSPATDSPDTDNQPVNKEQGLISNIGTKQHLPSDKPKMSKDDLAILTEKFAELQGARPRGNAWLPIQQGMKAMVIHEGYSLDEVEGCMVRCDALGWTWTLATVRRWIAAYAEGTMPSKNGSGLTSREEENLRMAHDPSIYKTAAQRRSEERKEAT